MAKVNYFCRCTVPTGGSLTMRTGPGTGYGIKGYLHKGDEFYVTEISGSWYKHGEGWSNSKGTDNHTGKMMNYIIIVKDNTSVSKPVVQNKVPPIPTVKTEIRPNIDSMSEYDKMLAKLLQIRNIRGIHGMPYQFMSSVDRRLEAGGKGSTNQSGNFGRKYAERIVARMPLLLITPGEPDFLMDFDNQEKRNMFTYLKDAMDGEGNDVNLDDILKSPGRYFTLKFAYAQYYKYVNSMLRMASRFLNLHEETIDGKKLNGYNWETWVNKELTGVLSQREFVAFYIDSETQISESFSNATTESVLSSKAKGASDLAREIDFLLGAGAGVRLDMLNKDKLAENTKEFNSLADKLTRGNQIVKMIGNDMQTVMTGGKLVFPEIWSDSTFNRSYDINIKLRTPDSDKFSWFMNIFVPLAHLICLTAPRQVIASGNSNPNAYSAPFLVRAFYKGLFSVEMGIITSMSISKGQQSAWTADGLPTQIDINLNIKDLYETMYINQFIGSDLKNLKLMKNTAMVDYIATSCGININKIDVERMLDLWIAQKINRVTDLPMDIYMKIEQTIAQGIFNFLK